MIHTRFFRSADKVTNVQQSSLGGVPFVSWFVAFICFFFFGLLARKEQHISSWSGSVSIFFFQEHERTQNLKVGRLFSLSHTFTHKLLSKVLNERNTGWVRCWIWIVVR